MRAILKAGYVSRGGMQLDYNKWTSEAKQRKRIPFSALLISYVQCCSEYMQKAYRLSSFVKKAGFAYQSRADPMSDRCHRSLVSKILKRDSGENVLVLYRPLSF